MNRRFFNKVAPVIAIAIIAFLGFTAVKSTSYKCMIQLTNYTGEGAYVVISLLNPDGEYDQTLFVQGDDSEWYSDMKEWYPFYNENTSQVDGITGATVGGGGRKVNIISIPDEKIDAGYFIRFESAVEDQEYYKDDVEFELTSESVKSKVSGKGFIRYVRMMPSR